MANTYLTRNMTTQGSSIKGTFSCWFKLANSSTGFTGGFLGHYFSTSYMFDICMQNGHIEVADYRTSYILRKRTSAKYRDPNAWYHLYVAIDRSLATAGDRCKIYVNGERVTAFQSSEDQDYSQQTSGGHTGTISMNNDYTARVGTRYDGNTFNGVLSHMYWVDGSIIDIAQFGSTDSTTGEWKIETNPTISSYGTNGFLILKDGNTITDQSGGSYDFASNGAGVTKTEDNPSNVFNTNNPAIVQSANGNHTYGNTHWATGAASWRMAIGTLGATKGKYYAECQSYGSGGNVHWMNGIVSLDQNMAHSNQYPGGDSGKLGAAYNWDGQQYVNGSNSNYGASYGNNDIIGIAMDLDNRKLYFSKNGVWQNSGVPTSGSTGTGAIDIPSSTDAYTFGFSAHNSSMAINFGNGDFAGTSVSSAGTNASGFGIFEYDVPAGYTALCTKGINSF